MTVPVLQLAPAHRPALIRHFLALDRTDRRLRFGNPVSDGWIADAYVGRLDLDRDAVFGVVDEKLELQGVAHLAFAGDTGELGISVLPEYRGRGIGKALFARAADHARNHRVRTFFFHCLAENAAIMHIAESGGMRVVRSRDEADAYLKLPPADSTSLASELLQDRLALFDFALKSQLNAARIIADAVGTPLRPGTPPAE